MTASTIFTIKCAAFNKLLQALVPEDSSLENVFLQAEWGKHRISIYAVPDDNYALTVEDFGYESKGVWYQATPTENQLEQLQKKLNTELARLYQNADEYSGEQYLDAEYSNQVTHTNNYINTNFYTGY